MNKFEQVWLNLGWLVVLVLTIAIPLALDQGGRLTYFSSLLLWALPILYLAPSFHRLTADGATRRRRALYSTIGSIVTLGIVLDFLLGHLILVFPGCDATMATTIAESPYVKCLPAVGGMVPIEELLFYALGPAAMVLVYACADERWLSKYNPPDHLLHARLVQVSPQFVALGVIALAPSLWFWRINGNYPTYYAFLILGALLPAVFLYRRVSALVNWPAFAVTTLYVLVTSIVWEVTLALPREWWGYNRRGMLGAWIAAWSTEANAFPVEAGFVWLCAPFSAILTYEFAKAFTAHPGSARQALFG